jgi:uncharacterized repeat protein (TIGR01451 family)
MALAVLAPWRSAGAAEGLALATVAERIVPGSEGAAPALVPATSAESGDELVFTITFTNVGDRPLDQVRITKPIPAEVRYVADTASAPGAKVLFSVDGGRFYGAPGELYVMSEDGGRRAATAEDYTHIRWIITAPLDVGARGFARFRAVVR